MKIKIAIINGPNLNLLGTREPEVYGKATFETYFQQLCTQFQTAELEYFQSNIEGEIVSAIQQFGTEGKHIIINPAAYTHTSIAIGDAISAVKASVIEVHISNIFNREEFRKHSYVSAKCIGVISGLGLKGYELAIQYLLTESNR